VLVGLLMFCGGSSAMGALSQVVGADWHQLSTSKRIERVRRGGGSDEAM
jgi:hypothetical protein